MNKEPWSAARQLILDGIRSYSADHFESGGEEILNMTDEAIYEATKNCRSVRGAVEILLGAGDARPNRA